MAWLGIVLEMITGSSATGNADGGAGAKDYVGGLVGHNDAGAISSSFAKGEVSSGKTSGALVGLSENSATITYSYARGKVTASAENGARAGGLVGYNDDSKIENSYAVGGVDMTVMAVPVLREKLAAW